MNGVPFKEYFILLIFLVSITSCKKETLDLEWEALPTGRDEILYRLSKGYGDTLWLAGGKTWHSGFVRPILLQGPLLEPSLTTDKALLGMDVLADGTVVATGVDGYIWVRDNSGNWHNRHANRWATTRSITGFNEHHLTVVGGNAFEKGFMYALISSDQSMFYQSHLNRLNDQVILDSNTVIAAGYGIMFASHDQGRTWEILDVSGDHFMQLSFPAPLIGYAVGYGGSILKTKDGGNSWTNLRNGRRLDVSDTPFLGLAFSDTETGILFGEAGAACLTRDGGQSWITLGGLPQDWDIYAGVIEKKTVILVGSKGRIYRALLP